MIGTIQSYYYRNIFLTVSVQEMILIVIENKMIIDCYQNWFLSQQKNFFFGKIR